MWAALTSPEAAAAVIALVGALLAAYWGGRAGGKSAVAAAQTQNQGIADQGAINARRVVYAEFARDARALADGVHQYVMADGPALDADTAAYTQVLDRARWSYDVVSIEGPQSVREAAKLFIDQAIACRVRESWHSSVVAAFNKLDALMLTGDGDQLHAVLALRQEMDQIRRAARALPQDWRSQARGWARNANTDLRARWQEERDRLPGGAPTFEDVATLVSLLRDHVDPAAPLNTAVQAGYLTSQDASKISTYAVTWAEEDDPRERVLRGLLPMQEALDAFVRKANRVLHPEESEEDFGEA